jgi:hypothetical protein
MSLTDQILREAGIANDLNLQRATEELAAIAQPAPSTTRAEVRTRDAKGRFQPKTKLTKSQKSQKTMQKVLAKKDETGATLEERVATHLLNTAATVDQDGLMAGAKALETVLARAHGKVPESSESLAALQRDQVKVVIITSPELMNKEVLAFEDLERKRPTKPSFSDAPFIEGELVSENSAQKA